MGGGTESKSDTSLKSLDTDLHFIASNISFLNSFWSAVRLASSSHCAAINSRTWALDRNTATVDGLTTVAYLVLQTTHRQERCHDDCRRCTRKSPNPSIVSAP